MMYQTFINYDEEYAYYSDKLKKYNAESLIELGCGTGSLASHFIKNGFDYTGLDLNKAMLDIARKKNSGEYFIEADMRKFELTEKKHACIIAGRSICDPRMRKSPCQRRFFNRERSIRANCSSAALATKKRQPCPRCYSTRSTRNKPAFHWEAR